MLSIFIILCVAICTFFVCRFYAAKTRLAEAAIDKAIARRLAQSPVMLEIEQLKEAKGIMRNLLIDLVENEASAKRAKVEMSTAEKKHVLLMREQRRREIASEALFVLQETDKATKAHTHKIDG